MTIIAKVAKDFSNIGTILASYEARCANWESDLKIDGKNIEAACLEQNRAATYDQMRVEVGTLAKYMEMRVSQARSVAQKRIIDNSQKAFGDRILEKMIDSDPKYLTTYEIYLEVEEVYLKIKSIVDQFTARGYSLNNIVKVRVADLQNTTLFVND